MRDAKFLHKLRDVIAKKSDEESELMVALERKGLTEIFVRHTIFFVIAVIGTAFFKVSVLIIWLVIYTMTTIATYVLLRQLTQSRSVPVYLATLAVFFIRLITFRALVLYLWFYPEPAAHYISIAMLIASVRFSVNLKSRIRSYLYLHSMADFIVFAIITIDFIAITRVFDGSYIVALSFLSLIIYYVVTLIQNMSYLAEMEQLEAQTRQAQKMEAVGRLTGGIAHDFNNILTIVMGNLELHEVADDPKERKLLLSQSRDAARRAAELTAQLLAFSRRSHLTINTLEVATIFKQVKSMSGRLLPANIRFEQNIHDNTHNIRADATQLEVALLNLIINARDAMPDGGLLSLKAFNTTGDGALPDGYVQIELTDEGGGIPDEHFDKVVEPFFTTKPVGEGSGLGLSMVKGFAEQSGGYLEISTVPDTSTTVAVILPAYIRSTDRDQT